MYLYIVYLYIVYLTIVYLYIVYLYLYIVYLFEIFLQEIFLFEPVHLDETFIASLITDIVRGMIYIHNTPSISIHGNLKSSNCLVTSRWVVKLSNFGLAEMRSSFKNDRGESSVHLHE